MVKEITLTAAVDGTLMARIDKEKKRIERVAGVTLSRSEVVRTLIREALDARAGR